MGTFNFKSVGKTQEQSIVEKLNKEAVPIGIKTPLQLGTKEGIFAMHYSLADQLHDNLRNLILTNHGERLGQYNFGGNLLELTFEFVSQNDFDAAAVIRIKEAVSKWMPFISLEDYISEFDKKENKNTAVIKITVTYTIPSLGTTRRALQIILYTI